MRKAFAFLLACACCFQSLQDANAINEMLAHDPALTNLYVVVYRNNTVTGLWEVYSHNADAYVELDTGDVPNYAFADIGAGVPGMTIADIPTDVGNYPVLFVWYDQLGGSPGNGDDLIAQYQAVYNSNIKAFVPPGDVTNLNAVATAVDTVLIQASDSGHPYSQQMTDVFWARSTASPEAGSALERLTRVPNAAAGANGGLPTVNASNHVAGVAASVTVSGTPSVNVTQVGGNAVTATGGRMEVNVSHWRGTQPNTLASGRVEGYVGAMGNDVVTAAAVADNAIDAGALAAGAITNGKIATGAFTLDRFTGVFPSNFPATLINASGHITRVTTTDTATAATSVTNGVTVTTNNDKSGYGLTSGERTTLASSIWGATTRVLTAGTNIVLSKDVGLVGLNDPGAATIANTITSDSNFVSLKTKVEGMFTAFEEDSGAYRLTAPSLGNAMDVADVQQAMTNQGYTTDRAGYQDKLNVAGTLAMTSEIPSAATIAAATKTAVEGIGSLLRGAYDRTILALPPVAPGNPIGLPRVSDLPEGGSGGGVVIPVNQVTVPESRRFILEVVGTSLIAKLPKGMRVGEPAVFAIDFRNDLAANGRIVDLDAVAQVSGPTNGITWSLDDAEDAGIDKQSGILRLEAGAAGTYVLTVTVTRSAQDGGGQATGKITIVAVD